MTLLELTVASAIMLMIVTAMGGLARTSQQSFEYAEGFGTTTQHARVALDRIARNVGQATANRLFPGCLVVAETVNSYSYPDTLVVWRPNGTTAAPSGLPCYNELIVYCPDPSDPSKFVEITAPSDTRTVPSVGDTAAWQTAMASMKTASTSKIVVLSDLLRTCLASASDASSLRGAVRFDVRLRPSATDWNNYPGVTTNWSDLPWARGVHGTQEGLRQVWVRTELQLTPGSSWVASKAAASLAVPYLGSAALYYPLPHP